MIDTAEIAHGPRASGEPCNATAPNGLTTTITDWGIPETSVEPKPGDDLPADASGVSGCSCAVGSSRPVSRLAVLLLASALGLVVVRRRRG